MRKAIKVVGLAVVLASAACGEGGGGGTVASFVGKWRPSLGAIRRVCPGMTPTMEPLSREVVWSTGVSSDLAAITPVSPCRVKADVAQSAAIGVPDDSCRVANAAGTSTVTLSRYAFAIAPDGRSAVESASGQSTQVDDGAAATCAFEESGAYEKIAD